MSKKEKRKSSVFIADPVAFRRALLSKRGPIRDALPLVRSRTPPAILAECIKPCLAIPAYRTSFVQSPFPKAFASIKPQRPCAPISPAFDFEWSSIILEHFVDDLIEFVELRDRFYNTMLIDQHDAAKATLDAVEERFGVSLWIISARIALLQASEGVTAQKEYLEMLLNQSGLNILVATVAFYLSFAAEEHVSKSELDRELDEIASGSAPRDVVEYFRYHSNPLDLPEKPHVVVALEENAPIIDRFETFVEMAQLEVARAGSLADTAFIGSAVERLASVPDLRVKNLCFLFRPRVDMLERDTEFAQLCEKYTVGDYATARVGSSEAMLINARNAWWYDLAVRSVMRTEEGGGDDYGVGDNFLGRILSSLKRQRAYVGDLDETIFRIQKLMLLGRRMPSSRYLASVDPSAMPMLVREDLTLSQWLWILSSPLDNPLHLRQVQKLSPEGALLIKEAMRASLTMQAAISVLEGQAPGADLHLPTDRQMQFDGHAALNRAEPAVALDHYLKYRELAQGPDKLRSLTLIYAAQYAADRYDDAVAFVAQAYLDDVAAARLVPLSDLAKWIESNQGIDAGSVAAAIILHAYSTLHGSDHDGDLSDAYENALDFFDVDRPTALLKADHKLGRQALVYFIRNICTVSRMEDGTGFDEIDDIENERVQLLQWLITADPDSASHFIAEIKAITKDQAVASLSAHLERSKIYVNEEAVRRSFDAEMRYSFARYRELLVEPNLEIRAEAIEARLRKLLREAEFELRDLKLPSTERDSLFRSLYHIALQEFLVYPNGGLKTYLSTRILHGALEGEMRSNLARAQLLFPRERTEAIADFEKAWGERLELLPPVLFEQARDAVLRFSNRFSENLLELINDKARIRLTTTPHGLLAYDAGDDRLQDAQQRFASIERYEEFIDALFNDFWAQTEVGLERVKVEIGETFADKVTTSLDTLAAAIELLGDDAGELLNIVVQARTEFALSVQRVSAWFARSGSLPEEPVKLDVAIEAAVRITNNCFPGCEVATDIEGDATIDLPGKWLNPIVDLFCNCFQNAVEHGGHSAPQTIGIKVNVENGLTIRISNQLAEAVDAEACGGRIAAMLAEADGNHHRATEEKGSGFCKISRIMRYDLPDGGTFDVSVTPERMVDVFIAVPWEAAP